MKLNLYFTSTSHLEVGLRDSCTESIITSDKIIVTWILTFDFRQKYTWHVNVFDNFSPFWAGRKLWLQVCKNFYASTLVCKIVKNSLVAAENFHVDKIAEIPCQKCWFLNSIIIFRNHFYTLLKHCHFIIYMHLNRAYFSCNSKFCITW